MSIGISVINFTSSIDEIVADVQSAADAGIGRYWFGDIPGRYDTLTMISVVGRAVPGIEFGTSIVSTYPRHPITLARQALTAQAATGNRLTLGIGTSHATIIEGMYGYSFEKPIRHMREYLSILRPLLHGETVSFKGETLTANGSAIVNGSQPPTLLVSAHGAKMLALSGELADGAITLYATAPDLASFVVPTVVKAAEAAGRPAPKIAAGQAVIVTNDADAAREQLSKAFAPNVEQPTYKSTLERQGYTGAGDVSIIGDEESVARQIREYFEAGVTDFLGFPFGTPEEAGRARSLLVQLSKESA
jgi:F420-dependent oxidoreductase-like protein